MQSVAVRSVPIAAGISGSSLALLLRSRLYLAAMVLVAAGFAVTALALQTLPVFVVQTARASSLAVTAALSVLLLGNRLRAIESSALGGVIIGLLLLALSAPDAQTVAAGPGIRIGLLISVVFLVLLAGVTLRTAGGAASGMALALVAGLCFTVPPLAARGIDRWSPPVLVLDPGAWALGLSALLGLALSALALQRTSVVIGTSVMVGTETILSAVLGVALFGDRPASGRWGLAVGGVILTLAASLLLARFGAPLPPAAANAEPGAITSAAQHAPIADRSTRSGRRSPKIARARQPRR
jgi:drug/metabolite transporter (DMT)-like permease